MKLGPYYLAASERRKFSFFKVGGEFYLKTSDKERKELIQSLIKHLVYILIISILGLIIWSIWGKSIEKFIQNKKWFLLLFVTSTVLYISWVMPVLFKEYKQNLRRTWYFVLIVGMLILLKESGFDTTNWQRYLYLAGMFIFVDLALFVTPTIKKLGGAEVENVSDIESINIIMQREIKRNEAKSELFQSILSRIQRELFLKKEWADSEEYRRDLENFLAAYGDSCMLQIYVFSNSVEEELPTQLGTVLGIHLNEEMVQKVTQEQIVEVQTHFHVALIPFSHQLHPVVIAVISEREPVPTIDVDHIINLSLIHTWQKEI